MTAGNASQDAKRSLRESAGNRRPGVIVYRRAAKTPRRLGDARVAPTSEQREAPPPEIRYRRALHLRSAVREFWDARHVLFISGYDQESLVNEDESFLQKPFSRDDLGHAVRVLLDSDRAQRPAAA